MSGVHRWLWHSRTALGSHDSGKDTGVSEAAEEKFEKDIRRRAGAGRGAGAGAGAGAGTGRGAGVRGSSLPLFALHFLTHLATVERSFPMTLQVHHTPYTALEPPSYCSP
tara:strand:+ start:260 stop:589 length:330 start_codon:yes stop_codon:yes gene_type:complete